MAEIRTIVRIRIILRILIFIRFSSFFVASKQPKLSTSHLHDRRFLGTLYQSLLEQTTVNQVNILYEDRKKIKKFDSEIGMKNQHE